MRRQAQKDWIAISRTPTWLGRLLIALALAAVFALLGQWQLSRALPAPSPSSSATSGEQPASVDLKTITIKVDQTNLAIISGRLQPGGQSGFWLTTNSTVVHGLSRSDVGKELTVAWGWSASFAEAIAAHVKLQSANLGREGRTISGVLADSEAPMPEHPAQPFLFDSLSVGQLINNYQPLRARDALAQFFIVQPPAGTKATAGLEAIVLAQAPSAALDNVNWLSAFYAIEWSVFAGFAVFMWWRLVEDERLRREADAQLNQTDTES